MNATVQDLGALLRGEVRQLPVQRFAASHHQVY